MIQSGAQRIDNICQCRENRAFKQRPEGGTLGDGKVPSKMKAGDREVTGRRRCLLDLLWYHFS